MMKPSDINLEMIRIVAKRIGSLREAFVFLGGASTCLLVTDPAAPEIRATLDVDIIVEVASRLEYHKLEETLRQLGFRQGTEPDDPICRWVVEGLKVDVMPINEDILGFSNIWYSQAIKNSNEIEIESNITIRMVTAPYFLATKIEAFYGRGKKDFLASHDMEDIITIIDGREEVIKEIYDEPYELRAYLSAQFQDFLANELSIESLSGHLLPDKASQARLPILMERIRNIAGML